MIKIQSIARLTAGVAATLVAVAVASPAFSQAPAKTAQSKPAPAPKDAPAAPQEPEVKYSASPWRKICQENPENKKKVCVLNQVLGVENQAIAKIDIIEMEGEAKKRINISVPLGMRLQPGMRITLDKDPVSIPFVICQPMQGGGATCIGDAEINADFITKMKKSNAVFLQMMNGTGRTVTLPVSNTDFTKVYDGPGMDAKEVQAEMIKAQEKAKAEEAQANEKMNAGLLKKGQEIERAKQQGK